MLRKSAEKKRKINLTFGVFGVIPSYLVRLEHILFTKYEKIIFWWKNIFSIENHDFWKNNFRVAFSKKHLAFRKIILFLTKLFFLQNCATWRKNRFAPDFFYVKDMYKYFGRELNPGRQGPKNMSLRFLVFFPPLFSRFSPDLPAQRELSNATDGYN